MAKNKPQKCLDRSLGIYFLATKHSFCYNYSVKKDRTMDTSLILSLGTILLSGGVAWGIVKQQVKELEERMEELEGDNKTNRELLIEIKTKVEILLDGTLKKTGQNRG